MIFRLTVIFDGLSLMHFGSCKATEYEKKPQQTRKKNRPKTKQSQAAASMTTMAAQQQK